ncbi:hypothetical protein RI367_006776 [Sorochytrium milnesiophthora]
MPSSTAAPMRRASQSTQQQSLSLSSKLMAAASRSVMAHSDSTVVDNGTSSPSDTWRSHRSLSIRRPRNPFREDVSDAASSVASNSVPVALDQLQQTQDATLPLDMAAHDAEVVRSGWVWRRGSLMQWKRYFAVARSRQMEAGSLTFYTSDKDTQSVRCVHLSECVGVHMREKKSQQGKVEFKLERRKGDMILASDSLQDAVDWCTALNTLMPKIIQTGFARIEHELSVATTQANQLATEKTELEQERRHLASALEVATDAAKNSEQQLRVALADAHRKEQALRDENNRLREQAEQLTRDRGRLNDALTELGEQYDQVKQDLQQSVRDHEHQRAASTAETSVAAAVNDIRALTARHIDSVDESLAQSAQAAQRVLELETTVSDLVAALQTRSPQQPATQQPQTLDELKAAIGDMHSGCSSLIWTVKDSSCQLSKDLNDLSRLLTHKLASLEQSLQQHHPDDSQASLTTIHDTLASIQRSLSLQTESSASVAALDETLQELKHQLAQRSDDALALAQEQSSRLADVVQGACNDNLQKLFSVLSEQQLAVAKDQVLPALQRDISTAIGQFAAFAEQMRLMSAAAEGVTSLLSHADSQASAVDDLAADLQEVKQLVMNATATQLTNAQPDTGALSSGLADMSQKLDRCAALIASLPPSSAVPTESHREELITPASSPTRRQTLSLYKIQENLTFLLDNIDKKLQRTHDADHELLLSIEGRLNTLVSSCETIKRNDGMLLVKTNEILTNGDDVRRVLANMSRAGGARSPDPLARLLADGVETPTSQQQDNSQILAELQTIKALVTEVRRSRQPSAASSLHDLAALEQHDSAPFAAEQQQQLLADIERLHAQRDAIAQEVGRLIDQQRHLQLVIAEPVDAPAPPELPPSSDLLALQSTIARLEDQRDHLFSEIEQLQQLRDDLVQSVAQLDTRQVHYATQQSDDLHALNNELAKICAEVEELESKLKAQAHLVPAPDQTTVATPPRDGESLSIEDL